MIWVQIDGNDEGYDYIQFNHIRRLRFTLAGDNKTPAVQIEFHDGDKLSVVGKEQVLRIKDALFLAAQYSGY
jgi:hypothetical protein